ncbi:hypothetical protein HDU93_009337 [Gonapodya sp. JEL0774]|nr:hypothetical protein HDU93_009337 [Gonapodya sp. JEL0774]
MASPVDVSPPTFFQSRLTSNYSHNRQSPPMSEPLVAANCCATTIVPSNTYTPKGTYEDNAELGYKIYQTSAGAKSKTVLIDIYDIWGFSKRNNNLPQVADSISQGTGFPVVIPDVFHGAEFTPEIFQSGKIMQWVKENGDWESSVKGDLQKLVTYIKREYGATNIGIFGFCYGGKIVAKALAELYPDVSSGALFHPSFLQVEDADVIKGPVCLLPSKDEAEVISTTFLDTLKAKPFGSRVVHKRFTDMFHGWSGTSGNFDDQVNREKAQEAIGEF